MNGSLFQGPGGGANSASGEWFTAHCDGGSRGNPGPAGYGAVIEDSNRQVVARLNEFLGIQTNNYAEYSGLLAVLKWAVEHGARRLRVVSDSELMVHQMNGRYKVASPVLRPLWEEGRKLARQLDGFEMTHTLRGGNKEADRLANEAMDRGMGRPVGGSTAGAGGLSSAGKPDARRTVPASQPAPVPKPAPKPERQVLDGYVKNGVVHLLGGELPEGSFVKVIRE